MATSGEDELREKLRGLPVFDTGAPEFDPGDAPEQPAELFLQWLGEAIDAGVRAPHSMTLSTVDVEGRPSSRVLILKGLDDGHWRFATSGASRKGRELAANPWAAASFYWPEVNRQVRIRGKVLDGGSEDAARDYLARPDSSRAESLAGRQSEVLDDPADLDTAFEEAIERIEADPEEVPEHWALYRLIPDEVEFWQADPNRRHLRLSYRLEGDRWSRVRLWP
jgi:pyridoxamine 5'-phosphate oxidase